MNNKIEIKEKMKMSISSGKPITGKYCGKMNIGKLLIEASENQKEKGILFIQNSDEIFLTYEQILDKATYCLGNLQESGLKQDDYAILSFENNIDFAVSFWACILGGITPVPITPPSSFKGKNASLEKIINVWNILKRPLIISDDTMINGIGNNTSYPDCKDMIMLNVSDLRKDLIKGIINMSTTDKPALIQFSSGSTNTPKGVILTHKNLLTNIEAIINAASFTSEDRFLSWMPFYHDMGLIGCHLTLIAIGMYQINMHPVNFVKRPTRWFDLIVEHNITLTSSPNFGFRLLLKKITEKHLKTWDLSRLRLIFNGAEPISIPLIKEFMEKLAVCNLPETSMYLVYGMAEACLAVTFPNINTKPESHSISRNCLVNDSIAKKVDESDVDSFEVANEGYPVPGMEVRIVDENGELVEEKKLGEIQMKGDNVTSGYINNPEATIKFFQDGWLKTGDIGFMIDKKLCVTGRIKDIIFINGQNFFAHDIEFKIEEFEGVESGKVVVCGWHDEKERREKVAIFSSLRVHKEKICEFYANILTKINETFGIVIEYVILTKVIPRTTSGKVQRFMLVKSFLNNEYVDQTFTSDELLLNTQVEDQASEPAKLTPGQNSDKIREIWGKVLDKHVESIGYNQSFLSLGGTSIKAVQVLGMLEDEFNLNLSHEILINCKTINDMDEYIRQLPKENISQINDTKTILPKLDEDDDIAVIEMSCRFPDASSPEEFWENIKKGKCSISEVPEDRWDINQYYSPNVDPTKTNCRTGAFLDKPFDFDAELFNISDEEAAVMDPQQRIILELTFEILERAGYSKEKISGKSLALFIGASTNAYYEYHLNTLKMLNLKSFDSITSLKSEQQELIIKEWKNKFGVTQFHPNLLVDNILNMIAARTSQELNLKGPSIVVDTACSSSIVTIHMACESLRRGECELAIAGGINLLLTPTPYIYLSNAGALSTSGVSKVFDAKADGLVPGEGAGLVLLKPLKKAIEDNDNVLAVIKASAINNDGHSIGVMAPNPDGQRAVIESLYLKNGIDPSGIQYVEAHGTGTKIGDPSEVRALDSAYKRWNPKVNSIAIGSVKANIGHLLNSAGIASFIKVVLALNNKIMPPNVNLTLLNPAIKFDKTPFYTIQNAKNWDIAKGSARRASINSFGFGGTNCHMVVEEAPELLKTIIDDKYKRPHNVLCICANTNDSLKQKIDNLVAYLKTNNENNLGDICYTENVSRSLFKNRVSVVSESCEDLLNKLEKVKLENTYDNKPHKIAFMFTGQGAQYVGMARDLYENLPIFKSYVDECSEAFYPYLNEKLTDLIYSDKADKLILSQTNITQPVVFAIDYAFGKLFIELGVKPSYMLGHSIGEWSAACLAGVVSLEDAARIVTARGKLMHELQSSGGMCAVFTSGNIIEELLKEFDSNVWIAAYNGTHQVISGEVNEIEKFCEILLKKEIGFKILDVSQAFHTPLMNPILDEFRKVLESVTYNSPKIPIISNITGEIMDKPFDAEYWIKHILASVKFEQSIKYLSDNSVDIFIECGPGRVLAGMASGIQTSNYKTILLSADRKKNNFETCLGTLGSLFSLGININFEKLESGIYYNRVKLPLYPFQRKTYKPDFGLEDVMVPNSWFYSWNWLPEDLLQLNTFPLGNIIIFDDGNSIAKEFESLVDGEKNKIYVVNSGTEYSYDFNRNFIINPLVEADYIKLFKDIPGPIAVVIHLWNLKEENFKSEVVFENKMLHEDIYSVLCIGKALTKADTGDIKLLLVTNGGIPIENYKVFNPHQSVSVTLALAVDQENAFINSYCIDIDKREYKSKKGLAQTLLNEISSELNTEGIVVIRDGSRYIRSLVNMEKLEKISKIDFNDGETYLITGGLSPVGSEIAKEFARKAKINLVLTGRKMLPLRDEWDKEIANNTENVKKINSILELEKIGAKVTYEAVDVTKFDDMEALISRVNDLYGHIHGVIHAAGSWDSLTFKLVEKEIDTVNKVLQPKVKGTVITDLVTRKEPLKFFVMLSSVSCSQKAWSAGLGDYAAANSFMPAYSFFRTSENAPGKTITINYSLWSRTGMGANLGDIALNAIKAQGLNPLPASKAVEALMMSLSNESPQVIHIIDKIELEKEKKSSQIKVSTLDFKKSKNTRETVYGVIASQLQIDIASLDVGMNFVELGLDSLGAVKVMESLRENLGIELYPTLIFEYQTPDSLAQYIEKLYSTGFDEVASSKIDFSEEKDSQNEKVKDIAIIGASVRIPGANTLDEYWNILETGKCVITEVPKGRWSSKDYFSTDVNSVHTSYTKHGGFIDKPYDFDPLFFGMSPSEAAVTDPQQRVFLEVAWEALQQAGYGGRYKSKNIGVFVGCEQSTYAEHFANYRTYMELKKDLSSNEIFKNISNVERDGIMDSILSVLQPAKMVPDAVAGNSLNEVAARVSHCLDLTGPSLTINSACSSSLSALHLACESIRSGESTMSIVGGVNLNLSPTPYVGLSRISALSKTGTCYPFDSRADGMVLSEGSSAVILKPMEDAIRDKDNIMAVIKGSAINNDGHSQGITAPRPKGQAEAIRKAYQDANINPETVSYVETHGTGTPLGDPIEIEGLTHAFRSFTSEKGFCAVGSVKSSIGHMLSASGVTSLIKVILALKNKTIPQTVNYDKSKPNPNIDFVNSPFYVASEKKAEWKGNGVNPLRAGVNGFGFGGTNVHVVLEQAPEQVESIEERPPYLLQLTGRNKNVIKCIATNLKNHIEQNQSLGVASICFTMNNSQKELSTKKASIINSREHLIEVLTSVENGENIRGTFEGRSNPNRETQSYLILDGNIKMSKVYKNDLCTRYDTFNIAYKECMNKYETIKNNNSYEVNRIDSFATQYALGILLSGFGLKIYGMIAKGTGIVAAAVLAGLINLDKALEQLIDNSILENDDNSENNKNAAFLNCPILTSTGVIEEVLNIHLKEEEHIKSLGEFVDKNQVIIYPGNIIEIKDKEFYDDKLFTFVEMNVNENPVEAIITSFAQLYTLGSRYNPNKLFSGMEKKVILPTYPFENETYIVDFKEEVEVGEPDLESAQKKGLLKLNTNYTLTDTEKTSSFKELASDLKK